MLPLHGNLEKDKKSMRYEVNNVMPSRQVLTAAAQRRVERLRFARSFRYRLSCPCDIEAACSFNRDH